MYKKLISFTTGLSLAIITNILKELLISSEVFLDQELDSTEGENAEVII